MKLPKLKFPNIDANDLVITAAFALLFAGVWMYDLRLALVIVGGLLLAYGIQSEILAEVVRTQRRPK